MARPTLPVTAGAARPDGRPGGPAAHVRFCRTKGDQHGGHAGRRGSGSCRALPLALGLAVAACTACSPSARAPQARPAALAYDLALGDSLSRGVQPDAGRHQRRNRPGLPQPGVRAALAVATPRCGWYSSGARGRPRKTMTRGGICRYPGGSQLAAAVAFLRAHRGHVRLVTLDIGANDLEVCGSQLELALARLLRRAGHRDRRPRVRDPRQPARGGRPGAYASWERTTTCRNSPSGAPGMLGRAVALASERIAAVLNRQLDQAYTQAGDGVADVFGAFEHRGFRRSGGGYRNRLTAPKRGPDLPVDLGVRSCAARAEPACEPGRLSGHRRRGAQGRRPWLVTVTVCG